MVAQTSREGSHALGGSNLPLVALAGRYGTAAWGAALGATAYWLAAQSLTDDAYISLSAARNFAEHGQWAIVTDLTANTSTSPLNVIVLGVLAWVTGIFGDPAPLVALFVSSVLAGGVIGASAGSITHSLGRPWWLGALATTLVLANPFVLSSLGLEVLLIPAVLMVMTAAALRASPTLFGTASGLAVLVRLDLALFVLLIAASAPSLYRHWKRALAVAAAVSLPWYVFSWLALGSLVPDTLVLKEGQAEQGVSYFNGPTVYFEGSWWGTLASFTPAAMGLTLAIGLALAAVASRRLRRSIPWPVIGLGLGAGVYYLAYSALDTVAYHWYYVTPMVSGGVAAVFLTGLLPRAASATVIAALVFAVATSIAFAGDRATPWTSPPIFGNWASAREYAHVGREIGAIVGGAPVSSPGEVGTLAYYCDCTIVDEFTDRGLIIEDRIVPRLADSGPLGVLLIRANYANLDYRLKPVTPVYRIEYGPGPGDGSPWTWTVDSAARGVGHFQLVRNG